MDLSSSGKNISRVERSETSEMFWPREDKIHIFWKPCNVLSIKWALNKLLYFLIFSENLRKSLEVFGNILKFSENFGNGHKSIFQMFS